MAFWTALGFLTIFPTPARGNTRPGRALTYFPLVGLLLGLVLVGLHYGLKQLLPIPVTSVMVVIALAALTGGHHLDGLADTFDGLGGISKEERLKLMAETGSGTGGAAAITLLLLAKYLALQQAAIIPALLMGPTLARGAVLGAIFVFPAARSSGMGYTFKRGWGWRGLVLANLISLSAAVIILGINGLILAAILYLTILSFGYYLRSKLGGLTGDNYGALIEIGEALVFMLIILL